MRKTITRRNPFESKFKPKIQKAISETGHTVLTEDNRREHKNQITGPIYTRPDEQINNEISEIEETSIGITDQTGSEAQHRNLEGTYSVDSQEKKKRRYKSTGTTNRDN